MPYYFPIKRVRDKQERTRILDKLLVLRHHLDQQIPAKTSAETLLLATWNIREFGDNRRTESLYYIAEILARFDLIAVQEVSTKLNGLEKVVSILGYNWDYIVTDSTEGSAGGGERTAFIFDKNKVFFRKMAGELVLPLEKLIKGNFQFARTPFCAAFQAGWFKFNLATVHIYYGTKSKSDPRRHNEIETIAQFLTKRAKKEDTSYILLGDFNIFGCEDDTMKSLENNGFFVPKAIKKHPSDLGGTKHYDQIAFNLNIDKNMVLFPDDSDKKAGTFDFTKSVYTPDDVNIYMEYFDKKYVEGKKEEEIKKYYLSKWRTFQMSDHLPLWAELKIDFSNEYLENIRAD